MNINFIPPEVAEACFNMTSSCLQSTNKAINQNFYCDGDCVSRVDSKHLIKGNVYLRSLTPEQFTELVKTSKVPSISDEQFLKTYNISNYSHSNWWVGRKIVALPLLIYDLIIAITASSLLFLFPVFVTGVCFAMVYQSLIIPTILAFGLMVMIVSQGKALTRNDPEMSVFDKILTVAKKTPTMLLRDVSKIFHALCNDIAAYPSLINFWHLLMARLMILYSDAKGLKHFHYVALKRLYQAKIPEKEGLAEKHLERELIFKTFCEIKNIDKEKKLELRVFLDNQMEPLRRKKLPQNDLQAISKNIKKFSKNQFNNQLEVWKKESFYNSDPTKEESIALKYLLEPFFNLVQQFIKHEDQCDFLNSIEKNLSKFASELEDNRKIMITQISNRVIAQNSLMVAVIKMKNDNGYADLWYDRVALMLEEKNSSASKRRWEQLINPLLGSTNLDQDFATPFPLSTAIAFVFFNSLKQKQKPAFLNLLEKSPNLKRIIPNQEPQEIEGFNHKILVHLLPDQPQWILQKKELKEIFKVFLLCNKSKQKEKMCFLDNKLVLWSVFSRIATINYAKSNPRDLHRLAISLYSITHLTHVTKGL